MAFRCSNDRTTAFARKSKTSKLFRAGRRCHNSQHNRLRRDRKWESKSDLKRVQTNNMAKCLATIKNWTEKIFLCWRNVMYLMQLIFRFKETFLLEVTFFIRFQILFRLVVTFCCCCRQHFFLFCSSSCTRALSRSALNPISNSNGALWR